MTDLNKLTIMGRCVKQPDLTTDGNGLSRITFTLAVNRSYKKNEEYVDEVSFIDFTIFGTKAENLHKWLTKGKLILVEGYLKQERWQDKDGKTLSKLKVVPVSVNPWIERLQKDDSLQQPTVQEEEYLGEDVTVPSYENYPDSAGLF